MIEGLLEGAHRYAVAANALMCYSDLAAEAEVNAAIGMSLLLKSLLPMPEEDSPESGLEYYALGANASEDLLSLYGRIDRKVRLKLGLRDELSLIVRKRGILNSRSAVGRDMGNGGDNDLVYCLGRLIPRAVGYFKDVGSKNVWVCSYPAIPEAVRLRT
ncbi:hypothetical protein Q7F05_12985 [Pseudomonas sp. Lb2C1-1]|uniref:hypothetical protein n=1 Tax=Pseudomonas TaxID=286 RepID=UPI00391A7AEC